MSENEERKRGFPRLLESFEEFDTQNHSDRGVKSMLNCSDSELRSGVWLLINFDSNRKVDSNFGTELLAEIVNVNVPGSITKNKTKIDVYMA